MRTVSYALAALKALGRHRGTAERIRRAVREYAENPENPAAHASEVVRLVGASARRMRVGSHCVILEETDMGIVVTNIALRDSVFDGRRRAMDETVTLTREEYQDLIDARDHAAALREIAAGIRPTVPDAEVDVHLAGSVPLAAWRKVRGITQAALARKVGISQAYLSQIEGGKRTGDVRIYARMATALGVRMEDLVADDWGRRWSHRHPVRPVLSEGADGAAASDPQGR